MILEAYFGTVLWVEGLFFWGDTLDMSNDKWQMSFYIICQAVNGKYILNWNWITKPGLKTESESPAKQNRTKYRVI